MTKHLGSGEVMAIYDASMRYQQDGTPLCVLAGKEYGTGSSRDWAAKGTFLLGVKFVLAESYERIHRSNLVGMGVLPLEYLPGQTRDSLGLSGHEVFDVAIGDGVLPRQKLTVTAIHPETGKVTTFDAQCRIDTPVEVDYYRNGGILQTVLRKLLGPAASAPVAKVTKVAAPATPKATAKVAATAKVRTKAKVAAKAAAKAKPAGKAKGAKGKPAAKMPAAKKAAKPKAKATTRKATKPTAKKGKPVAKKAAAKHGKKPVAKAKPVAKKGKARGR